MTPWDLVLYVLGIIFGTMIYNTNYKDKFNRWILFKSFFTLGGLYMAVYSTVQIMKYFNII